MSEAWTLHSTACAICEESSESTELYPSHFSQEDWNSAVFSARRLPDGIHYRIVKCNKCGLVRSDPVAPYEVIANLYSASTFDYGSEVSGLKQTYARYLRKTGISAGALLEIGCGNGFFLEEAKKMGFTLVAGVEPGSASVAQANTDIRDTIKVEMMRPGLFERSTFDVVCLFQVFDHLSQPNEILTECRKVLKPNGKILLLNHNAESLSARFLGERSPIIDIEHTYLYSPTTISHILNKNGFRLVNSGSVWNTYSLSYLTKLLPLTRSIANRLPPPLGSLQLTVPLGNLYAIAAVN